MASKLHFVRQSAKATAYRVWDLGIRVWVLEIGVLGFGGLGLRVWDFEFRV